MTHISLRPYVRTSGNFAFPVLQPTLLIIELKLGRMMLVINSINRSGPDFPIFFQETLWGCFLKSSNWFTAYSSYWVELKLGRMMLDIRLHNCLNCFPFSWKGKSNSLGGVPPEIFKSIHCSYDCAELGWDDTGY